ncbi:sialidase family protein [Geobacter sp. DSM 9736]|uniref:sialidase family protein n=1 Tax=Geobacter sp. DSM 9736 TaxID=1277350 RepID=UPI000B512435|nr:sialidase family protein [Geobacter sp. DSM 9736]
MLTATVSAADPCRSVMWEKTIEIAAGHGERGPWQQNESSYDYVDDPTVDMDYRGNVSVAWVDQADKDIFFQRFSIDGKKRIGDRVNISRTPETFSWLPRLVVEPKESRKIYIIWQEIIFSGGTHGGEILFAYSVDGGESFSEPVNLSKSTGGDGKGRINRKLWDNGSLDMVVDTRGTVYAAWTEYDGALWFSRSSNGGKTFSSPRRISGTRASPARAPSLSLGPGRTLYLAWTVGEQNSADIHLAASPNGGEPFHETNVVARTPGYSDAPKLEVDRKGVLHLVYAESLRDSIEPVKIIYTSTTDGGRTFLPPRDISGPVPKAGSRAGFPDIEIDAEGKIYVVWESFQGRNERPRGLAIVCSKDGGRRFTIPKLIAGSADRDGYNGSHQGLLMKKLAVNPNGEVVLVNSSLVPNVRSRVWMVRGKSME